MNKVFLKTEVKNFEINLDEKSSIYKDIISILPIWGNAKIIEGEIFYIINNDIKYDWSEKIKFDIWDIVYWRSQKTDKFAIAIFYWNTKFDNFNSPSAASPAIKIWKIKWNCNDLKNILNDTFVSIEI